MTDRVFEAFQLSFISWYTPAFRGSHWIELKERMESGDDPAALFQVWQSKSKALNTVDYAAFQEQVSQWLELAQQNQIRYLTPVDSDYPTLLKQSGCFPALLSYRGAPVWKNGPGLAVVGARKMAQASQIWMDNHLPNLMKSPYHFLVSGGAEGVDQYVHRTCLRMNFPTLAILPSGLLHTYPKSFSIWIDLILRQGGAVVSIFGLDQTVRKNLFHLRNRVIASLSETLIVVQAERRSGSYLSARLALDEGRRVGVVPGHPTERAFGGCLDLLFDGAEIFRTHQDIMSTSFAYETNKSHNQETQNLPSI